MGNRPQFPDALQGVVAVVVACVIWGLSPLYYHLLRHIPPIEVLAHRTIWSCAFFSVVLIAQGRFSELGKAVFHLRTVVLIGIGAILISINWFGFIVSIQIGKATEASLGYYLFPLVAVAIGRIAFGERLNVSQRVSVASAMIAVVVLTYGLGVVPWIALVLSCSFGFYGLVKKRLDIGPVVSVTAEVWLLVPIAMIVLGYFHLNGDGVFGTNLQDSILLAISGVLTGTPLILFSFAAKRVRLGTIGVLQYINPTLQFFCAVFVFGEAFTQWHSIAFSLIWLALIIYSVSTIRQEKAARRASVRAGVS